MIDEFHNSQDIQKSDIRMQTEKNKTQRYISIIKFLMASLGFAIVVTLMSVGAKHEHWKNQTNSNFKDKAYLDAI